QKKLKSDVCPLSDTDTEDDKSNSRISNVVRKYLEEIEELKAQLCESEATCEVVRKELSRAKRTIFKPTENVSNGIADIYLTSSCYAGCAIDGISLEENAENSDFIVNAKRELSSLKAQINHSDMTASAERSIQSQIMSNSCGSHDGSDDNAEDDQTDSDETE
uniref:KIF21A/B first helical domain-containing protein n=1 Tax=Romanomermis culicivorax TaxID=13658 RepID=A0A915HM14_ROMCU